MNKFDPTIYHWSRYRSARGTKLVDAKGYEIMLKAGDLWGLYEINRNKDGLIVQKDASTVFTVPREFTDKLLKNSAQYNGKIPKIIRPDSKTEKPKPAVKAKPVAVVIKPKTEKPKTRSPIKIGPTVPINIKKPSTLPAKVVMHLKPDVNEDEDEIMERNYNTRKDLWGTHTVKVPELEFDDEGIPDYIQDSFRDANESSASRKPKR